MDKDNKIISAQKVSMEILNDLYEKLRKPLRISLVSLIKKHGINRSTYARALVELGIIKQVNDSKVRPEYVWGLDRGPSPEDASNIKAREKAILSKYTQNRKAAAQSTSPEVSPGKPGRKPKTPKATDKLIHNSGIPDDLKLTLKGMENQLNNLATLQRSQKLRQTRENDWQEALYSMKLHEKLEVEPLSMEVIRVVGGWIYINKVAGARTQMVFVRDPQSI
jgi:hypothetical protein